MVKPDPDGGAILLVKVVPGASRTAYVGQWNGRAKIAVAAPPEKGRANEALVKYLVDLLAVKRSSVVVSSGHGSPLKTVRIGQVPAAAVAAALEAARS